MVSMLQTTRDLKLKTSTQMIDTQELSKKQSLDPGTVAGEDNSMEQKKNAEIGRHENTVGGALEIPAPCAHAP